MFTAESLWIIWLSHLQKDSKLFSIIGVDSAGLSCSILHWFSLLILKAHFFLKIIINQSVMDFFLGGIYSSTTMVLRLKNQSVIVIRTSASCVFGDSLFLASLILRCTDYRA